MKTQSKTKRIVLTSMICALAYICVFVFRINVSFLTFDLKNVILAIGAMILGPVSSILSSLIVSLLEMITVSGTGFYGFIMNFLSCISFTVTIGIIYNKRRTLPGAIVGFTAATLVATVIMILFNLIVTPYYNGVPLSAVIDMIPTLLLPFNLIKAILTSAVTLLVYKPFCSVLSSVGIITDRASFKFNKKSIIITISSVVIIAVCVTLFVVAFKANFSLFTK